ncbi:unnamed protein product [Hymenolepis diminuta]|uniref:BTB domain-containing protein n=1 Tax=Hymenolepis diminuta TaxID=6216 RepID=A0A0R3STL3_HYMDI|nr:unnamed protein product [Hymenolepis diminuta]
MIVQTKRSLMNNYKIVNSDAKSNCFTHFRGIRVRRDLLDIFINPLSCIRATVDRQRRFPRLIVEVSHEVLNVAVYYAYGGIEYISPEVTLGLYLLAHNLQNKALVDGCTQILCPTIEETNVSEAWSAGNAAKNEVLIGESLATFDYIENALKMCILNPGCSKVEIQRRMSVENDCNVFAFQNEFLELPAINIPDSGVLVIGGIASTQSPLRSTELLTRRSGEVEDGGGVKWQWQWQ